MTDRGSEPVVHPVGAATAPGRTPAADDVRRALVEQFLRNGDSGDDVANSDLVAAVCASIRRAQGTTRTAGGAPRVS